MVEVDDKVFVTPVDGQKDYIAVVTGPGGAGAVLNEGNYNTWTLEWIKEPANGIQSPWAVDALLDERNGKLSISYKDNPGKYRFAIYNLSDFSIVYESPVDSYYTFSSPNLSIKTGLSLGMTYLDYGGMSQSIQTYLLLLRSDEQTIEVWRGGAAPLWSYDVGTDFGGTCYCYTGGISLTGKYVLMIVTEGGTPYGEYLALYKGSYVE